MAYSNSSEAIEALAAEIGEQIYLDVAKWHLYLGDAKLHTPLAEKLYPMLTNNQLEEKKVTDILSSTSIQLGGGRREVAMIDLLPTQCQSNLMELLEDYQRKL
ncbi:MAG: DUF3181 family protein [Leptolyngbya sp. SIO4C5]|uniref:DUF3181 family protein n=1 Tax=Sphaerothrix gracilis TaxID=3151835 RepID=UPI0013C1299D|nr:DUF3181 family protein [Leptolyngbya sp. SIO4C5]